MSRRPGTASLIRAKSNLKGFKGNRNFNTNFQDTVERTSNSRNVIKTFDELDENNISEFFKDINAYDGFFTTQQLQDVDFSKFENHVFFDSAVDKINYAYDKILNKFPYDKSFHEFKQYFIKLDGFTKYIYDNFIPKSKGYLKFDGNSVLNCIDNTGNILDDYSLDKKIGLINLNQNKFSFDFWLYVSDVNNNVELGTQIIFQKIDNNNGITIFVDTFDDDNVENKKYCNINCILTNSNNFFKIKSKIPIAEFVHVNFSFNVRKGKKSCKFYKNGIRKKSITEGSFNSNLVFNDDFLKSSFKIGNGNNHLVSRDNSQNVVKSSGLKGFIDEFRFFIGDRPEKSIVLETTENIFSNKYLQIYYKFNEPSGEYLNNNIVLDSSGHRVHGIIKNFDGSFYTEEQISQYKKIEDVATPLIYEKEENNPVLFSKFGNILQDQQVLIKKAKKYDKINPNVFWKFFPKSMFVNESDFSSKPELFVSEEFIGTKEKSINLLEVTVPKNNLLINLISIWARFFDQLKCYIDQIVKVNELSYDELNENKKFNSIALPYAVSKLGFDFKEIFPNPVFEKTKDKNLTYEKVFSQNNIRQIQNNLWKRFLINSQDYIRSKGTKKSIHSVFNSFGLEADLFIKIREFNFQNKLNFYPGLIQKNTSLNCIDFNNLKLLDKTVTYDANGLPQNNFLVETKLSVREESQNLNMTSGDWSIELFVKFDHLNVENYSDTQSIFRIDSYLNPDDSLFQANLNSETLNSETLNSNDNLIGPYNSTPYINLIFKRDKKTSKKGILKLCVNHTGLEDDLLTIDLNDVFLLSGKIFYIHVGKKFINSSNSVYYIDISKSDFGSKNSNIISKHKEMRHFLSTNNKSFILRTGFSNFYSQNIVNSLPNLDLNTNFQGKIVNIKAWKKLLNSKEKSIHKSDIFCTGLETNNIISLKDQLFINTSLKEKMDDYKNELLSNNKIVLKNFAEFGDKTEIYVPDLAIQNLDILNRFDYITLKQSTNFDYPENYNRVNINSYENNERAKSFNNYNANPSHETESEFNINNNVRLSIDFSTSNFIDKEISKLILVNDYFTQNLSNRSNMYEESYKSLEELRNVFYEKIEKEISISQLYQIYKYFDNILEEILYETVPLKVNYQGFNFVVESSIAERNKYVYKMSESRIPIVDAKADFNRYSKNNFSSFFSNSIIRRDIFNETSNLNSNINN